MRAYVRSLDPQLSRHVWTLLSGSFANALGNGIVFPFLLIYLHNVRGIPLGTAGLVLAATSVAGLVAGPASGTLIDHLGPRAVLCASMVVSAAGFGGFALVHSPGPAFVAAALAGLGNGSFWPSHAGMVAALTERETRHNAYAMQRVLNNLGIGVGGVVGRPDRDDVTSELVPGAVRDRRDHVRRLPRRALVRSVTAARAARQTDGPPAGTASCFGTRRSWRTSC